ncbi:MAG: polysaccharide pyruvyl transferase family protein, partial [Streptomyces sp.]
MKRILLRSLKSPLDPVTPEMVLQQRVWSANFGNFVFSDSAHKMLMTERQELSLISDVNIARDKPEDIAARVNESCDAVVLPFANALRGNYESTLRKWTEVVRRLRVPVTVLGIGAQSTLEYETEPLRPLDDTVRTFCAAVLDRSPSIGVRGEFTQRYLAGLGFSDVEVIGCPSMFRYGNRLEVERKTPALTCDSLIAASYTDTQVGDMTRIFQANYDRYPRLHFIAQDLRELEIMYFGDTSEAAGIRSDRPRYRSHPAFTEDRVRLFLDPVTWINTLGEYDFSFGTRIHGTITSLLGGTPSVVLCHDSRTRELSEYFAIPHRRLCDLAPDTDAAELYEEADWRGLVDGHQERFERMTGFLVRHGLDHVYTETGDQGAAFEKRMADTDFAPPVRTSPDTAGELGFRTAWLYANTKAVKQRQAAATMRIATLEQHVADLRDTARRLSADLEATRNLLATAQRS